MDQASRVGLSAVLIVVLTASGAAASPPAQGAPPVASDAWEIVLERTAELRGLPVRAPVPRSTITRQELQARVNDQLADAGTLERLAVTARLYRALGLLDATDELPAQLGRLRGSGVEGAYNSRTGELFVVTSSAVLGPMERMVAVHEYTHALQYQHYPLREERGRTARDGDAALALQALLEGDASLMMARYAFSDFSQAELQGMIARSLEGAGESGLRDAQVPAVLRETMVFPYREGARFITAVVGREATMGPGYGEALDPLFRNPPRSTAEILHPERYLRGQGPERVELGDLVGALGAGWRVVREGTLGELYHRLMLEHALPKPTYDYDDYEDEDEEWDDEEWDEEAWNEWYERYASEELRRDEARAEGAWGSPAAEGPEWNPAWTAELARMRCLWDRPGCAAEGWTGDRFAMLESTAGDLALVLRTRWDDANEADEWLDAYADGLAARHGTALVALETAGARRLWATPEGIVLLGQHERETVLVLAPSAAQALRLAEPGAVSPACRALATASEWLPMLPSCGAAPARPG